LHLSALRNRLQKRPSLFLFLSLRAFFEGWKNIASLWEMREQYLSACLPYSASSMEIKYLEKVFNKLYGFIKGTVSRDFRRLVFSLIDYP
jgi:hypothetical protein